MSLLSDSDTLKVTLSRDINGIRAEETVEITYEDVQFLNTPQLLRYFVEQIERAQARLDATEEYVSQQ